MAKTHHRRRRRRVNRTRRGGVPKNMTMTPAQWAKSLLSSKGKAGITKSKSYAKPKPDAGDTSAPARGASANQ